MDISCKPLEIESDPTSPKETTPESTRTDYGWYCTYLPSFQCNCSNVDTQFNKCESCLETFCYPFTCVIDTILNSPCPV